MKQAINLQVAAKLLPLITKPKRIKIAVGGRGASKSIGFGDACLYHCDRGKKILCAREFQSSIDESVHSLLVSRINHHAAHTLTDTAKTIISKAGGEIIYKGLARNPDAIKSMFGVDIVWVEEASSLSQHTIDVLLPTIREADSEIWMSVNRGASTDAFSKTFLRPYEKELERSGYFEDDEIIIVQINYTDNPWFPDVLEQQRSRDFRVMTRAKYDHVWGGQYSDSVENAIIHPEWFDACIDAHEKLGFKAEGVEVVAHDPADKVDAKGLVYIHGSVLLDADEMEDGDVNTACDWAMDYAEKERVDIFTWDGDGMGAALRRQINDRLGEKNIRLSMFKGSTEPFQPGSIYMPIESEETQAKTNKETFLNQRSQGYWMLRDRIYKTWQAVEKGVYHNPSELLSIKSSIDKLPALRSEVCQIPLKTNSSGKIQLMTKVEMLKLGIPSPNMADSLMMGVMAQTVSSLRNTIIDIPEPPQLTSWMNH